MNLGRYGKTDAYTPHLRMNCLQFILQQILHRITNKVRIRGGIGETVTFNVSNCDRHFVLIQTGTHQCVSCPCQSLSGT